MRFGYGLSRLLGSVYGNGNVVFLPPDSTCILSPVRNRVVSGRRCSQQLSNEMDAYFIYNLTKGLECFQLARWG